MHIVILQALARVLLLIQCMTISRIVGIVLLAAAAVLLFFGIQATGTFGEKVVEGVTGKYTHNTMVYIVSGVCAAAAGLALVVFKGKA